MRLVIIAIEYFNCD